MKSIKNTPQELLSKADIIKPLKETAGDIVLEIQELYDMLGSSGAWKGAAYDEIVAVTKKNRKKFESIEHDLDLMESFLRRVADAMQEEDSAIMSKINAISI